MNRTAAKILVLIGSIVFFAWFYYRYVPLIPAFQAILAPILALLWIITAADAKKGLLAFCFIFPLINSLPYFFGIDETIPHAAAALVAFLVFVLGRLTGRIFVKPDSAKVPLALSLKLLAVWGGISALITFLRYMDFFPLAAPGLHEFKVNAAGLSAGGARMSVVFTSASLLSGIAMFAFFRQAFADPSFKKRLVNTLTLSASASFLFGYFQSFQSVVPGSTPYWNKLEQINATFKDPNSLAAFIAGFVPLVIIYALGQSGVKHALLVVVGGLGLGLLPLSGSRSGMAAVAVAAAVFVLAVLLGAGKARRKRVAFHVAGFLLFFVAWNIVAVPNSALSLRIGWSIYQLKEKKPPADPQVQGGGQAPADPQAQEQVDIGDFFNKRLILWSAAGSMFRTAPLTGVGPGAFIVTFPDYLKERGRTKGFSDSALNLVFQIGAETGLVGLVFSLAFLVGLIGRMAGIFRFRVPGSDRNWLGLGAVCGLAAFFFNFLFHTYVASFEIQFLFWFLAALVFSPEAGLATPEKPRPARSWVVPAAAVSLLVASAVFLAVSLGKYSIGARAEKYGWTQAFGFYDPETDAQVGGFRWTGKAAGFSLIRPSPGLVVTLRAANPDLAEHPVTVRVYRTNRHFRKSALAGTIVLKDASWTRFPIEIPDAKEGAAYFLIEPDRTWSPRRSSGSTDGRDLGIEIKTVVGGAPALDRP